MKRKKAKTKKAKLTRGQMADGTPVLIDYATATLYDSVYLEAIHRAKTIHRSAEDVDRARSKPYTTEFGGKK